MAGPAQTEVHDQKNAEAFRLPPQQAFEVQGNSHQSNGPSCVPVRKSTVSACLTRSKREVALMRGASWLHLAVPSQLACQLASRESL